MQHRAMLELPLGMTLEQLALELELDDRDRLLHARDVCVARSLRHELRRRIVAVDLRELAQRLERDALAFFELRRSAVAQRQSHDGRDRSGLAEARRDPVAVMVAERNGNVGLLLEQLDHLVDARAAIAE